MGPDAVILSSGRIGDEVEVVAAIDVEVAAPRIAPLPRGAAPATQNEHHRAHAVASRLASQLSDSAGAEGDSRVRSCSGRAGRCRPAASRAAAPDRVSSPTKSKTCAACSRRSSRRSRGTTCRVARRCRRRCSRSSRSSASRRISPARWCARFRRTELRRGAPLRAGDHRAHRAGHRRSLAGEGRRRRLRRSRRRRQDHADRQARRALGAASRPAPRRAGFGRRGAHRRARTDAHARSPARRHRAYGLSTSRNCRSCWMHCAASSSC